MASNSRLLQLAVVGMAIAAPALSQAAQGDRFCLGGNLSSLSAADRSACSVKLNQVREASASLRTPGAWHFVVVCNETGWADYSAFSSRNPAALESAAADTDSAAHTTYLRASRLADASATRQVLAAELFPAQAAPVATHAAE